MARRAASTSSSPLQAAHQHATCTARRLSSQFVAAALSPAGYVRTGMTGGQGLIDTAESVSGLISVLEGNAGPLNGQWYDYAGRVVPW